MSCQPDASKSIENAIKKELPCLSHVLVVGEKKKFLSCLLTFEVEEDPDTLEPKFELAPAALGWCSSIGSKSKTTKDILKGDVKVQAAIQAGIDKANLKAKSNGGKVQKFVILDKDFSVAGGELTPTMKLRKDFILDLYKNKIDQIYA